MATKKVARNAIEALSPRHRQAVRLLGEHVGRLQILLDRLKDPANQHDLTEAIHEAAKVTEKLCRNAEIEFIAAIREAKFEAKRGRDQLHPLSSGSSSRSSDASLVPGAFTALGCSPDVPGPASYKRRRGLRL